MLLLCLAALVIGPIDVCPATGFQDAKAPSAAIDDSGTVYVAFGQGKSLYYTFLPPGRQSFATPKMVAEAGALALGMRRGPRISVHGRTIVISAVAGQQGRGKDENLYAWTSLDGGRIWQPRSTVNDVHASAREGLHAMTYGDGRFVCTWLDLREPGTTLYASTSKDGVTWSKNEAVYKSPSGSICECCHPSVAITPAGNTTYMWRNSVSGDRDMFFQASNGTAQKLGAGAWKLKACPMDGGAIAVNAKGQLFTVWRRESTIYACQPGQPEKPLGSGEQPWLAIGTGGPIYAWLEKRDGKLLLLTPSDKGPRVMSETANDPVVAASPSGKFTALVWTDASSPGKIRCLTL